MPKRRIRLRSKYAHLYVQIPEDKVPEHIDWRRSVGGASRAPGIVYYFSFGKLYKKILDETTGQTMYFRMIDDGAPAPTPKEQIDAEPTKGPQVRYHPGKLCWFIDTDTKWYLCRVVKRGPKPAASITIKAETGWDAERVAPWPYGSELEFPALSSNRLFQRLRPLKARTP